MPTTTPTNIIVFTHMDQFPFDERRQRLKYAATPSLTSPGLDQHPSSLADPTLGWRTESFQDSDWAARTIRAGVGRAVDAAARSIKTGDGAKSVYLLPRKGETYGQPSFTNSGNAG
ncbi:hypothetical protein SBV1_180024 [Verrucomicrobia bacterium]|nr:hypothetical protein SBV1_180024 [Verrucomicrobiota bacterium]